MLKIFQRLLGLRGTEKESAKVNQNIHEATVEVAEAKRNWMQNVSNFEQDMREIHKAIMKSTAYRVAKKTGNLVKY